MSEKEHLIFFSSEHSTSDKHTSSFTVDLPYTLNLEGEWKCAVLDFYIKPDNTNTQSSYFIYILADFCETSIIFQSNLAPILKKVYLSEGSEQYEFPYPLYIPLKQNSLIGFNLVFLDSSLRPINLNKQTKIECTLHFIKNE